MGAVRSAQPLVWSAAQREFSGSVVTRTVVIRHEVRAVTPKAYTPPVRVDWQEEVKVLSTDVKEEITHLRNENPFEWSLSKLSQKYQISRRAVGAIARLDADNKERVKSANIYKMNPSSQWKGPIHYRKVRNLQKEREQYDAQREKEKRSRQALENAKAKATLV